MSEKCLKDTIFSTKNNNNLQIILTVVCVFGNIKVEDFVKSTSNYNCFLRRFEK